MALVMGKPDTSSVWRRIYDRAATAAAYAVAEREPGSPEKKGKDCNVCDKEGKKLDKAKKRRHRRK